MSTQTASAAKILQSLSFLSASTTAVVDGYFAQSFAKKFGAACGMSTQSIGHLARYCAIETGLAAFALNHASLINSCRTLYDLHQQRLAGLQNYRIYGWGLLIVAISALGAIPAWQFGNDATQSWNTSLALIFCCIQFINVTAANCRPILETTRTYFLSSAQRELAQRLRQILITTLYQQKILSSNNMPVQASNWCKKIFKLFVLLTAPTYAVSYFFAAQTALKKWPSGFSLTVALLSSGLKCAFMWRVGLNLVDKIFASWVPGATLHFKDVFLTMLSIAAGVTAATASAGGLLKYLLPQMEFFDDPNSLNGVVEALAISVVSCSFSKIFDIDNLLRNISERIANCWNKPFATTSLDQESATLKALGEITDSDLLQVVQNEMPSDSPLFKNIGFFETYRTNVQEFLSSSSLELASTTGEASPGSQNTSVPPYTSQMPAYQLTA